MVPKPKQISSHSIVLIGEVNVYEKILTLVVNCSEPRMFLGRMRKSYESIIENYIYIYVTPPMSLSSRS